MSKCAVFCSQGIGDGLIFCQLSYNLQKNGYQVDTYHNSLVELKDFFPGFSLKKMGKEEDFFNLFSYYDILFFNLDSQNEKIARWAKEKAPDRVFLLKPTTCKGKNIYREGFLDIHKTVAENLVDFCQNVLHLKDVEKNNGMVAPKGFQHRKYKKRIAIHPTSRDPSRNWPEEKFYQLKAHLEKKGYEVVFIVAPSESKHWQAPSFSTLKETAIFLYESGFFVGNDSGMGHLASSLHIPTVTIFSSRRKDPFWRPDWDKSESVRPSFWIPNIKGFRLRDKIGNSWIQVSQVERALFRLIEASLV